MRKISRRSFLAASAAAAAAGVLTACGASSSSSSAASSAASSTASSAASSAAAPAESYTIGICQLVEHEALDAATQGFQDALVAQFGDAVSFDMQNAQNDTATCATICNGFVSAGVDLIMANGTAALQAAQAATADIPILGTSITEYGVALGIDDFDGTVGGNVSGTSDLAPLEEQAAMIVEWMPEAKTAGLLYCSAEANSQYQVDVVQAELEAAGMTVTQYPFSDSNDLSSVCQQAGRGGHLPRLRRGHPVHQLLRPGLHHRRDGRPDPDRRGGHLHHGHPVHHRHQEVQPHHLRRAGPDRPRRVRGHCRGVSSPAPTIQHKF